MPYPHFDETKPDSSVQSFTSVDQSNRDNFAAIRDMVVTGAFVGWNFSKTGADASLPDTVVRTKGTQKLRGTITWGTTGGELGNPTSIVYHYSSDNGSTWNLMGTQAYTWDANGNLTSTTWS